LDVIAVWSGTYYFKLEYYSETGDITYNSVFRWSVKSEDIEWKSKNRA